jgi:hypothetical protein
MLPQRFDKKRGFPAVRPGSRRFDRFWSRRILRDEEKESMLISRLKSSALISCNSLLVPVKDIVCIHLRYFFHKFKVKNQGAHINPVCSVATEGFLLKIRFICQKS